MSPWPLHGQILWLHKARLLGQCHESSAGAVYRCSMPPASPAHTRYCFFFFNIRNFLTIDNTNTEYNHAPRSIQIHQNSTSWILFNTASNIHDAVWGWLHCLTFSTVNIKLEEELWVGTLQCHSLGRHHTTTPHPPSAVCYIVLCVLLGCALLHTLHYTTITHTFTTSSQFQRPNKRCYIYYM